MKAAVFFIKKESSYQKKGARKNAPGKNAPRKNASERSARRKITPRKYTPKENCPPENCPPPPLKKVFCKSFFMLWNIAVKISLILIFVSLNFCGL